MGRRIFINTTAGGVALLLALSRHQFSKKQSIIFINALVNGLFALQLHFLGAEIASIICCVNFIKGLTLTTPLGWRFKTYVATAHIATLVIAAIWLTGFGLQLLILTPSILWVYAEIQPNMLIMRNIGLLTHFMWVAIHLHAGSIGGVCSELCNITSACVGIYRFHILPTIQAKRQNITNPL